MMEQELENRIRGVFANIPTRAYLFILPASGHVRRITRKFAFVHVGGKSKSMPMIYNGRQVVAFDPRCLVVWSDDPAHIEYHPREVIDRIHTAAVRWLTDNPGVFVRDVTSGVSEIA